MRPATTALASPTARNTCGMVQPRPSSSPTASALAIMNSALRMLLAAMMRARWLAGERSCTSAYIGTL